MDQATLTVKIVKDEGFTEQLLKGTLSEAQKDVVRFIAKQAVEEYIRQTKPAPQEGKYDHPNRIIRLREAMALTGLSRSTIYKLMNEQRFPNSVKLGPSSIGWRLQSIQNWLDAKPTSKTT